MTKERRTPDMKLQKTFPNPEKVLTISKFRDKNLRKCYFIKLCIRRKGRIVGTMFILLSFLIA